MKLTSLGSIMIVRLLGLLIVWCAHFCRGHGDNVFDHHPHECGFQHPAKKELDAMQGEIESLKRQRHGIACKGCITIDTYMYVFKSSGGGGSFVDNSVVEEQMRVLNDGFVDTPFKFDLKEANIEFDDYFHNQFFTPAEQESDDLLGPLGMVTKWPRRGNYATLNLYYAGVRDDFALGFAYFPVFGELATIPFDGVFVNVESLPGGLCGSRQCGSPGVVTVHEVGHWLGLPHVFQSLTERECDPSDPNDYVDDTPQMRDFNRGSGFRCPDDSTDTCPSLPGKDPIHNYMDYSSEGCKTEFTPGQIERMYYVWSLYREDSETCSEGYKLFEFEILTDDYPLETTWNLASTDGDFYWDANYQLNGVIFAYFANTFYNQQICIDDSKDYVFTIYDDPRFLPGDGIFEPGYYEISYDGTRMARNSNFGDSDTTSFSGGGSGPKPPPNPIGTSGCFSDSSLVNVQDNNVTYTVPMSRLQIGDRVQTGVNKFEPVYSFAHRAENQSSEFIRISTAGGETLILTPEHMVYVKTTHVGFVPASRIRLGDILQDGQGHDVVVTTLRTIKSTGIYAPFTPSGNIVVNNVLASCYVAFNAGLGSVNVGGYSVSCHWLAHALQFPHRLACHYFRSCRGETYTKDGISNWIVLPSTVGHWVLGHQKNQIVNTVFLPMIAAVLAIFSVLEIALFTNPIAFVLISCLVGYACSLMQRHKRRKTMKLNRLDPLETT